MPPCRTSPMSLATKSRAGLLLCLAIACQTCWARGVHGVGEGTECPTTPRVMLVSQATPNITDYSVWSFQINRAYAIRHGYSFYVANASTSAFVGNERDVRWSKVKILQDLMLDRSGGHLQALHEPPGAACGGKGRETVYMWIDADAVVFNFDQTVEAILGVAGRSDKDLVICRQGGGGNVANTGVFFLRSGAWASRFLAAWWQEGRHRRQTLFGPRHEQWALDSLLEHSWVRDKVALAPAWEFNTLPPFYATTTAKSFVMHLMHEPYGLLREKVLFSVSEAMSGSGTRTQVLGARVVPNLCGWALGSYRLARGENYFGPPTHAVVRGRAVGAALSEDEDLLVMNAQALERCQGRHGAVEAMSLYARATEVAPSDPDTWRIAGQRAVSFWRSYGLGDVCDCERYFQRALALETNALRQPELIELGDECRVECDAARRNWSPFSWTELLMVVVGTAFGLAAVLVVVGMCVPGPWEGKTLPRRVGNKLRSFSSDTLGLSFDLKGFTMSMSPSESRGLLRGAFGSGERGGAPRDSSWSGESQGRMSRQSRPLPPIVSASASTDQMRGGGRPASGSPTGRKSGSFWRRWMSGEFSRSTGTLSEEGKGSPWLLARAWRNAGSTGNWGAGGDLRSDPSAPSSVTSWLQGRVRSTFSPPPPTREAGEKVSPLIGYRAAGGVPPLPEEGIARAEPGVGGVQRRRKVGRKG